MTMMVVTHEMGFASKVAHCMDKGEIVKDALKTDFFGEPRSDRAEVSVEDLVALTGVVIPGRLEEANPESRDSGFALRSPE
jgi:ABC-type glutathione transport system ATPase component